MAETKVQEVDINDLVQDKRNFNKGSEQGQQLMERSFKELGAGRSILLDKNGNIILDTFGGSGTTIVACEQLGRKARLMELDPHYCDVIIARWEKLTGEKAVKLTE